LGIYLPFAALLAFYWWVRNPVAQSHGLSGDYNYNWVNLPFNFIGNLAGYLGETMVGFGFLNLYDGSRVWLRSEKAVALVLALAGLVVFGWLIRKLKPSKALIFWLAWAVILLLPFLGLGNITERYSHLAKFGFLVALVMMGYQLFLRLKKRLGKPAVVLSLVLVILILGFYGRLMVEARNHWHQAGETVNTILLSLGTNHAVFPDDSQLYFVNVPVRLGRAWVFPVGFKDGLWLIYQNDTLVIHRVDDLETTFEQTEGRANTFIFVFENKKLKEATRP
jgi:hypothetical protein